MDKLGRFAQHCALILIAAALTLGTAVADQKVKSSIPVVGKSKADYPDLAKIFTMDAVKRAQEKYPGKVIEVALEEEHGYLVYKVELVRTDNSVMELGIDAGTGDLLFAEEEKDHDD